MALRARPLTFVRFVLVSDVCQTKMRGAGTVEGGRDLGLAWEGAGSPVASVACIAGGEACSSCRVKRRFAGWGLALCWLLAPRRRVGQFSALSSDKKPEPPKPTELVLSPAAEPVPALRYRLLPLESTLLPGDAAPIYLRIRHEQTGESLKELEAEAGRVARTC